MGYILFLRISIVFLFLLVFEPFKCYGGNITVKKGIAAPAVKSPAFYKRTYQTNRLTGAPPEIDGQINDPAWELGNWSDVFVQQKPLEGAEASERTIIKVLYDEKNLYVAFRCFDSQPDKIHQYVGKRDEFTGDMVGITFDSYFDQLTAYEFNITAGGSKIDLILKSNGEADLSWNAVWYGATAIEDSAWTAEMQIPLSQLRYNDKEEQVWGMHAWRWINRLQEQSQWSLIPRNNAGVIYSFGELHGLAGLSKSRRVEFSPYMLSRLRQSPVEAGNPFSRPNDFGATVGFDGKLGIGSDFTVDYTINPDFGQVEADPSSMNLSAFETFYSEKRPFFLEGKNVLDYSLDGDMLFYSRRIGRTPLRMPGSDAGNNVFVSQAQNTSILNAVKFTGKTSNGMSIGVMQSFTNKEFAEIDSSGVRHSTVSQPYTNYALTRIQQDYNSGNTVIGGILTVNNRMLNHPNVYDLVRNAYSGGFDALHHWNNRKYYVNVKGIYSHVNGAPQSMLNIQQSSVHFFQRPDAFHLNIDSGMTSLNGHGGTVALGRSGVSKLTFQEKLSWRSPGLELNDMGFLRMADYVNQKAEIRYKENEPAMFYREYQVYFELINQWDFGGLNTRNSYMASSWMQLANNWSVGAWVYRQHSAVETRELRGGPALRIDPYWHFGSNFNTDWSKVLVVGLRASHTISKIGNSNDYHLSPMVFLKVNSRINVQGNFSYSFNNYASVFVANPELGSENRYIMGRLNQETLNMTLRFNYNLTPNMSVQYYGSPFFTHGGYNDFKLVNNSMASLHSERFEIFNAENIEKVDNSYIVNKAQETYSFDSPDFDVKELNSNLVLRWEYRPGSVFFLVWSHHKRNTDANYTTGFGTTARALLKTEPNNVFMFKLNYYFAI